MKLDLLGRNFLKGSSKLQGQCTGDRNPDFLINIYRRSDQQANETEQILELIT